MWCTFPLRSCILSEGSFLEAEKGKLYQVKVCQFTRLFLPAASCLLTLCHHAIIADVTLPEMVLPRSPFHHYSISSCRTNFPAHPISFPLWLEYDRPTLLFSPSLCRLTLLHPALPRLGCLTNLWHISRCTPCHHIPA